METQTKKPVVKLSGKDGNVFNLIGICSSALKRSGQHETARLMTNECFGAGSYHEALAIMARYCDLR